VCCVLCAAYCVLYQVYCIRCAYWRLGAVMPQGVCQDMDADKLT